MNLNLSELAAMAHGRLTSTSDGELAITSTHTDSRRVGPGDFFVPIIAERDGHDFIEDAIAAGAIAWLTARPDERPGAILVSDTSEALALLGGAARLRINEPVIGVTGSSGKTSTKDLVAAILAQRGPHGASEKSFNNELGVPLTLLNTPNGAVGAVIEMGARGLGHIATLCAIARPTVGIVTNVGTAHLAMYDQADGILLAKGELVQALPSYGTAVLNFDDPSRTIHERMTNASVLTFSAPTTGEDSAAEADVTVANVALDAELRPSFDLRSPWGVVPMRMNARGRHQVANAAAAATAMLACGWTADEVAAGLATDDLSHWRMEIHRTPSGAVVINDAYNANDQSMAAALRALAELPSERRIAVLGTMAELGDHAPAAHAATLELARELGIDVVVAVGEPLYQGASTHVEDREAAARFLRTLDLGPGDAVLIKASRVAGLEQLADQLIAASGSRS